MATVPDILPDSEAEGEIDDVTTPSPSNPPQSLSSRARLILVPILSGNKHTQNKPFLRRLPGTVVLLLCFYNLFMV